MAHERPPLSQGPAQHSASQLRSEPLCAHARGGGVRPFPSGALPARGAQQAEAAAEAGREFLLVQGLAEGPGRSPDLLGKLLSLAAEPVSGDGSCVPAQKGFFWEGL